MKAFVNISMAIFSSTTLISICNSAQKGRACGNEQVALSAVLKTSQITEALGVKDPSPPLFLRYRLLIKAWAWKQGDFSNID